VLQHQTEQNQATAAVPATKSRKRLLSPSKQRKKVSTKTQLVNTEASPTGFALRSVSGVGTELAQLKHLKRREQKCHGRAAMFALGII